MSKGSISEKRYSAEETKKNSSRIHVRLCQQEDEARWNSYVEKSDNASIYHLIKWKKIIEKSFGHKTHYLLAEDENKNLKGILPLVQLKSLLFGNFMVSLPFFNYGGICADQPEIQLQLLDGAIEVANREGVSHIELRETRLADYALPVKTAKVSMLLELPSSSEKLSELFPSKLKSQIKRPQKEGMGFRIGREEELESFYDVFSENMRDLGTPVYSKRFFKNILEGFPESTWIGSVYDKRQKPVASAFLIGFKNKLEIPWASSLKEYNHVSPNMFLYGSILQFACENRFRVFDFGRSTPGEGTYRFKAQWGARPHPLYWYYWTREGGALPELNPKNAKYQAAINIWKRLPLPITRFAGPFIVKNLP